MFISLFVYVLLRQADFQEQNSLRYEPYKIDEEMTKMQFNISDLEEIQEGIHFTLYKDNVVNVSFDRTKLSEAVKNFAYISVGTSDVPIQMERWSSEIYDGLVNGDAFQAYSEQGFPSVLEDRNCIYIVLFNINRKPVAYYQSTNIRHEQEVELETFNRPSEEVRAIGKYELDTGTYFEYFEEYAILHVNQDAVPSFSHVGIWSSPNPINEDVKKQIKMEISEGIGIEPYLHSGFEIGYGDSGTFLDDYWIVYLLDDENNIIKEYVTER